MRPVRLGGGVRASLTEQLHDRLRAFWRHDLAVGLDVLATVEADRLHPHGPGWRLTIDRSITVAGFHMFAAKDSEDPRPDALIVYHVDVWLDDWPDG